jgi:hypothetical protein
MTHLMPGQWGRLLKVSKRSSFVENFAEALDNVPLRPFEASLETASRGSENPRRLPLLAARVV